MVRVRNLVLAIAAATALTTEMAHALGLGEVTLQSSLNQPLIAEIELLDANSLAPGEVIPVLASLEEFNRAGIDRQYFLTDLKFTPVLRPNGKSVIQVSSSKPVREPYLNFLVEVLWPSGRLLREYTLLLDPPLYSPETAAAAAPQLPISAPSRTVEPVRSAPARPSTTRSTAVQPVSAPQSGGSEYKTSARDTLWEIAERNRRNGTVHQAMLAIQDLNPDAFIGGNINRMKSGQVLRLPDAEQISTRSQAEAIAQVAEQNAAWRQGSGGAVAGARQLDATRRTEAGAAPSRSESRDSLRLVAADAGKETAGSDTGSAEGGQALRDKLAVTQESLDSSRRENDDLKDRLNDLQGQLEKLQRLMQLKDDQLAKLQAQVGAEGQAPALDANASQPAAAKTEPQATEDSTQEPARDGGDTQAGSAVDTRQEPAPVVAPPPAEQSAASKPAAKPASPAKPVAPVVEPEPKSLIDDLLSNTLLLGVVGGSALLLLLLGLMALSRRNAMKEAELQESLMADDTVDDLRVESPAYVDLGQEHQLEPTSFHADAPTASDELTSTTGDALAEADIYIAYGRFNQAAELLQNALNDEPQRSDLRLKLMEVYAELGNRDGFAREEAELREIGGATTEVEQLKYKYPAMAAAIGGSAAVAATHMDMDSLDLDDLHLDEPAAPAAGQDLDDAFDLSLDDLDIDLNEERPAAPAHDSLDFDDLTLDEPVTEREASPAASDFSFDLAEDKSAQEAEQDDLSDFSFDLDSDKGTEQAPTEFSLNLDEEPVEGPAAFESDDLDFELSEPVANPSDDLPEGFDISLDEPEFEAQPETFADKLNEVEADLDDLSKELEEPATAPADNLATTDADGGGEDDFDFFSDTDETTTKLDLARAYIDMGDAEGARDILDEVISEGSDVQQQEAREMLAKLA